MFNKPGNGGRSFASSKRIENTAHKTGGWDWLAVWLLIFVLVTVAFRPAPAAAAQAKDGLAAAGSIPAAVSPGPFNKSAPANGATGLTPTPTLKWGASSGATKYEYCIDTTNDKSCGTSWVSTGTKISVALTGLHPGTSYYWQVRATKGTSIVYGNGSTSAWWSFKVAALPGTFNKTGPANTATGQPFNPKLSWGASSTASLYEYCIDTSNNNACNASWISAGANTSAFPAGLNPGSKYYWQVRATNAGGVTYANGSPTTWWSFTVQALPGSFSKTSPTNGITALAINGVPASGHVLAAGHSIGATLKWTASTGATSYEYCIDSTNDNACSSSWNSVGTNTSAALSDLTLGSHYYWQVRARNAGGITYADGGSTFWWSFTVSYSYRDMTAGFVQTGWQFWWEDNNTRSFYDSAAEKGIRMKFFNGQGDLTKQATGFQGFIDDPDVNVIVLNAVDPSNSVWQPLFLAAQTAGKVVVLEDQSVDVPDSLYATRVSLDALDQGHVAATEMCTMLAGSAHKNVVEILGPSSQAATDRDTGFRAGMGACGITITQSEADDWSQDGGALVMADFLATSHDIQGVFAQNDQMGVGATQAIQDASLKPGDDIKIVSIDGDPDGMKALNAGYINTIIESSPYMAPQAYQAALEALNGATLPKLTAVVNRVFHRAAPARCSSDPVGCAVFTPGQTIKIGMGAPMTGENGFFGQDISQAAMLAVADAGTFHGFSFGLDAQDDGGSGSGAVTVANNFVADPQVVAVAGHIFSGASMAAIPIYEAAGIPMMSPSATNPSLTSLGSSVFNRCVFPDPAQGRFAANYLYNKLGIRKLAVLHDGESYGQGIAQAVNDQFITMGGSVVAFQAITPGGSDYSAVLASIATEDPEALYYGGYTAEAVVIVNQMGANGLDGVTFFSDDGTYGNDFLVGTGANGYGAYSTSLIPPDSAAKTAFDAAYQAAYGIAAGSLTPYTWTGYDSAAVLIKAVESVAILQDGILYVPRFALVTAVRSTGDYAGLSGTITCDSSGECAASGPTFVIDTGGVWVEAPK